MKTCEYCKAVETEIGGDGFMFVSHDEDCIYVRCDYDCRALNSPVSLGDVFSAYMHWRYHSELKGCSHGN